MGNAVKDPLPAAKGDTAVLAPERPAAPTPNVTQRHIEDVLCRAPYPVRPLAQTLHYQFSRLTEPGIDGDIMLRSMRRMPVFAHYNQALFGTLQERLAGLAKLGRFMASGAVEGIVADWSELPPDNVVAFLALRQLCDRLLGDQANREEALRQANRCLLQVHHDKIARLSPHFNDRMQPLVCEDITLLLRNLRKLLSDEAVGPGVYSPTRLTYGHLSLKQTVLPALLLGAAITASFFFPAWATVCLATLTIGWLLYTADAAGLVQEAWQDRRAPKHFDHSAPSAPPTRPASAPKVDV